VVKPHTSIRAGTSLGSMCKIGGEISGSIIAGNSNKQHHGFLGDSYVGGWVNLGAGATNSNLKNTYGPVNVALGSREVPTGLQFFGCLIGDFARVGIGEMIPTGAVIGFAAMVATGGLCEKFVPSFAWHTAQGREKSDPVRVMETAQAMMKRRNHDLCDDERQLFRRVASLAEGYGI
jgi:UDP-N-acetylglucosamine diphosphorylase/glucosamine-1-phosphate N-acetyltransferase